MLDLKFISTHLEAVKTAMNKRRAKIDFALLTDNDEKRKALLLKIEELRHTRNTVSDEIASLKKSGEEHETIRYLDGYDIHAIIFYLYSQCQ